MPAWRMISPMGAGRLRSFFSRCYLSLLFGLGEALRNEGVNLFGHLPSLHGAQSLKAGMVILRHVHGQALGRARWLGGRGWSETHLSACGDTTAWGRAVIAIFLLIFSLHEFCCECFDLKGGGAACIEVGNRVASGEGLGKSHALGYVGIQHGQAKGGQRLANVPPDCRIYDFTINRNY